MFVSAFLLHDSPAGAPIGNMPKKVQSMWSSSLNREPSVIEVFPSRTYSSEVYELHKTNTFYYSECLESVFTQRQRAGKREARCHDANYRIQDAKGQAQLIRPSRPSGRQPLVRRRSSFVACLLSLVPPSAHRFGRAACCRWHPEGNRFSS